VLQECGRTGTTAVIAHTDFHATRLVEVADSMGVAVPEDLAVIAYDDELAESAHVPLTAVTAPRLKVGRTALALMLERLDPTSSVAAIRHVELLPNSLSDGPRPSRNDQAQTDRGSTHDQ
jgi:DNA-binding LacI/PurR family transcriptional regulator